MGTYGSSDTLIYQNRSGRYTADMFQKRPMGATQMIALGQRDLLSLMLDAQRNYRILCAQGI